MATECPIVRVEEGQLQGRVVQTSSGKSFLSYQGIPYAKPPLGLLRFKAPQPPESWEGVRDATAEGNVCAQIDHLLYKDFIGDENCLYLNVYTPTTDGAFLPVMVFIHGGGYAFGSGNSSMYGADYLVEKEVVVVTINYRCGVLGFLSLNTANVPGNAGLKDMVQALRWIAKNIQQFGGNPGNITLFGENSGGAAVSVLTASPLTKNLVKKAIIQSGNGLNSWAWQKRAVDNAKALARKLGCDSEDIDVVLEYLTTTPVRELVEADERLHPYFLLYEKLQEKFAPVIEREFPGNEAVLTEAFIDIITSGRVADIPVMIGSTTLEIAGEPKSEDVQDYIPDDLKITKNSGVALVIATHCKEIYLSGEKEMSPDNMQLFYELLADKLVNIDIHRYVKYLVHNSNKPVYHYLFDYVGELNVSHKVLFRIGLNHAAHMDDLGYLFKNRFQDEVTPTVQDLVTRERMVKLWTNFAKEGNPTPEENEVINVTWLPASKDHLYCLKIAQELSLGDNPRIRHMEFWDDIYTKHFRLWDHPSDNTDEVEETHMAGGSGEKTETPIETPQPAENPTQVQEEVEQVIEPKEEVPLKKTEDVVPVEEPKQTLECQAVQQAVKPQNGSVASRATKKRYPMKTSNEVKYVGTPKATVTDVVRANDPPQDDLPKDIGVNKFVNFFENLGHKK